jgi:putative transposase
MQIQEDPIFGPYEGKGNLLLFPASTSSQPGLPGAIGCRERLGGLLKYYHREAA